MGKNRKLTKTSIQRLHQNDNRSIPFPVAVAIGSRVATSALDRTGATPSLVESACLTFSNISEKEQRAAPGGPKGFLSTPFLFKKKRLH